MRLTRDELDILIRKSVAAFEQEFPHLMETSPNLWVGYYGEERLDDPTNRPEELVDRCLKKGYDATALYVCKIQPPIPPAQKTW